MKRPVFTKDDVQFVVSLCTVAVRASSLCDKAALLRDTIKGTVYYVQNGYANPAPCWTILGRGHTNLTSRELMCCYECSWDI
jgi:hypothetical protein